MNRSWKKQLRELYEAPAPQRKTEFLQKLNYPKSTFGEFVMTQAGYIHKYVWIFSAVLVFAVAAAGKHMVWGVKAFPLVWCISSVMPILVLLLTLETFRSEVYGMDELEQAAKHNLPEILLVRMGLIAAMDLLMIGAVIPVVVRYDGLSAMRAAVYLLVPYLFTCVLTFAIQRRKRGRGGIWYSMLASAIVCMGQFFSSFRDGVLYEAKNFSLWVMVLIFTGIVVGIQIREIRKNREEYGWNLYLTE